MVRRISQSGVALYANQAFCRYAGKPREEIEGCAWGDLAKITSGEVSECFTQIGEHLQPNALVTDSEGRVFEVKTARELGVLDIVLDEVTHGEELEQILRSASGTPTWAATISAFFRCAASSPHFSLADAASLVSE